MELLKVFYRRYRLSLFLFKKSPETKAAIAKELKITRALTKSIFAFFDFPQKIRAEFFALIQLHVDFRDSFF
jgi:hypothetical protein